MLTNRNYFFGNLFIARPGAELDKFIATLEPQWLQQALGYEFAKAFTDGLAAGSIAPKWQKLRDGSSFRDEDGILRFWPGFINVQHQSPVANYIYCRYTENNLTITTEKGERTESDNGYANTGAYYKQLRAWNEMVEMTGYIDRSSVLHPGILYNYLLHAADETDARLYPEFSMDGLQTFQPKNLLNL